MSGADGASRAQLFRRTVPAVRGVRIASVSGIRVSGHPGSDVALAAATQGKQVLGILTAGGAPLWKVKFAHARVAGGALAHHRAPTSFCV